MYVGHIACNIPRIRVYAVYVFSNKQVTHHVRVWWDSLYYYMCITTRTTILYVTCSQKYMTIHVMWFYGMYYNTSITLRRTKYTYAKRMYLHTIILAMYVVLHLFFL